VTDRVALALVPDLDQVARSPCPTWLDYDHRRRRVIFAAGDYRSEDHVLFVRADQRRAADVRLRLHLLSSKRAADLLNPYGMVARWFWRRYGKAIHERGGCQNAPLGRYLEWIARWAFSPEGWERTVWQSFVIGGRAAGAPAFIVDVAQHPSVPPFERRWREQRSIWNQAWFSTQRCANGLLLYARQIGSRDLERRARLCTEIALAAPQRHGLFPAVLTTGVQPMYTREHDTPDWSAAKWTSSDRRPASASADACHVVDAAHTCRMLLEWHDATNDARAFRYVMRFANRLIELQRASGAFPGWVEPDGRVAPDLIESGESAVAVTLLFELAARSKNAHTYRSAALRGLPFLERCIAGSRWEDFETWYSCCPMGRPGLVYSRNGVTKQSTLAMFWCAEAMLAAWRETRRARHLKLARRCIDELSLYQAVWDPPFLPAPAHGGFGVMNADSEWNDARQSVFAPLYLELYRDTGASELFERGVAALRASFSMLYCPENDGLRCAYERRFPFFGPESYGFTMENQGHGTGDPIGPFTIFSWGNGSALAAAATVKDRFGDVFIDSERQRAFGIDGCTARVTGDRVVIDDRFDRPALVAVYADGRRRMARRGRSLPL
jgi:hypothetical protein